MLVYALAGLGYAAITAGLVWPVWGELSTRLLGDGGDNFQFVWNAWWMRRAVERGENPFFCGMQFAPYGVPLVLHTLAPVPSLIIGMLSRVVPMAAAYNLVLLGFYPLAGLCLMRLASAIVRDRFAAFVSGLVFMLSPFMTSKSVGHLNLLGTALLPVFALLLWRTLEAPAARRRWGLAALCVVIWFTNVHSAIFAANLAAWLLVMRGLGSRDWKGEARRFAAALRPVLAVCAGLAVFVGYYAVRYGIDPQPFRALAWCPEPLNFALPLHPTSVWGDACAARFGIPWEMRLVELSVYLGWLVLPMALAGLWLLRRERFGRWMMVVFAVALLLAPGHKLQWDREIVKVAGMTVYLPMGLYRYVPVLGAVGQSGRYLVLGYMAMGVGVAALAAWMRRRWGRRGGLAAGVVLAGLIGADFAWRPVMVDLPRVAIPPGEGRVMDPRLGNPVSLYAQTVHGRELVGGYVARIPERLRRAYAELDGIGWFFERRERRGEPPSAEAIRRGLRALDIRYVCVDAGDADVLEAAGLGVVWRDGYGVVMEAGAEGRSER